MSDSHVTDRLEVAADTRNLAVVREFLRRVIRRSALAESDANGVVLAVDEAVANIILHGYEGREDARVEVAIEADDKRIQIIIRDDGKPYDTESGVIERAALDMQEHIANGNKRGLGLFIMRKVMDEVSYRSSGGDTNELTLVRHIKTPG